MEICCPSGLRGRIRGMRVKDEELFTQKRLVQTGRVVGHLLRACWEETLDLGPYGFEGLPNWSRVISADRIYTLIQVRIASYGPDYEFRLKCTNCDRVTGFSVDLSTLDCAKVGQGGLDYLRTLDPYPVVLGKASGDEHVVQCKLMLGEDEEFLATLNAADAERSLTYHLARRVVQIRGKTDWPDVLAEIENLPSADGAALWDATDAMEGGVDTMLDLRCGQCGESRQVMLPFDATFFSRRQRFARSASKKAG